jgi:drug/metabolite transporter (DMT)-like permease
MSPPAPTAEANARAARLAGFAFALVGAVAFSGKAILAKLMYRHGVDAVLVLFWRMAFAIPFFMLMVWWSGRGKPHLDTRTLVRVLMLGFFGYYLASYLDFLGLEYVSASLERLILYLNPTIVLLLGMVFFHKRATRWQLWAMAVSYCGVVLAFAHEVGFEGARTAIGGALVFGSAVSYAVYLSGSGQLVQRLGSLRLVGWASSVACILCIVQGLVLKPWPVLMATPAPVLWLSALNATVCTVIPMLLVMMGIERLGSATAAQVGMVGPMSTVIMGVLILGEPFTVWMGLGTALVLVGVAMLARQR